MPVSGYTALQALRKADVEPGQSVLVIGAAGGVGTLTMQIAKALGAQVTGVCSGPKAEPGPFARGRRRHRLHTRGLHGRRPPAGTSSSTPPDVVRYGSSAAP